MFDKVTLKMNKYTWKIVRVVKHYSNASTEELLKEFRRSYGKKKDK